MFTGIIEEVKTVQSSTPLGIGRTFQINADKTLHDIAEGDSIAINGVCLTVVDFTHHTFTVEAVEETIHKSTLGAFQSGDEVNIERALRAGGKLGGHYVQGHVDCTAKLIHINSRQESWLFWFRYPIEYAAYIVLVGSIAIDGVSLTIAEKRDDMFAVSIIPHTFDNTLFRKYSEGTIVNIEFDMIGKYVLNFLQTKAFDSIDMAGLRDLGY